MSWRIRLTRDAEKDLLRLFDFLLERELERPGGGDLAVAERALEAIQNGLATLASSPFTCRKAAESPLLRELVIPFGATGYVALFEIADGTTVIVGAVRHQREDDYH
ncbi:MAG: type II toxin-antitoxin system RelE/ParE family toxin [Burkholderiaceae bacterium]|nr:type II toxin-antitoxin system RelE/ParE family toxin [Burkholderiaceae bacterium]